MTAAAIAMGKAVASLDALKTADALPPEMEALNHLLKAQADVKKPRGIAPAGRQRRRQQSQRPGHVDPVRPGAAAPAADQLRNADERRAAARRRTTSTLDKIKELARRQDELLKRQQELARERDQMTRGGAEARAREADARAVRAAAARRGAGAPGSSGRTSRATPEAARRPAAEPAGRAAVEPAERRAQPAGAGQRSRAGPAGRRRAESAECAKRCAKRRRDAERRPAICGGRIPARRAPREAARSRSCAKLQQQLQRASPTSGGARSGDMQLEARQLADAQRADRGRARQSRARAKRARTPSPAGRRAGAPRRARAQAAGRPAGSRRTRRLREAAASGRPRPEQSRGPPIALRRSRRGTRPGTPRARSSANDCRSGCSSRRREHARTAAGDSKDTGQARRDQEDIARALDRLADRIGEAVTPGDEASKKLADQLDARPGAARRDRQADARGRTARRKESGARNAGDAARLRDEYNAGCRKPANCSSELRRRGAERRHRLHVRRPGDGAVGAGHRAVQAGLREVGSSSASRSRWRSIAPSRQCPASSRLATPAIGWPRASTTSRPPAYQQQVDSYFKSLAGRKKPQ